MADEHEVTDLAEREPSALAPLAREILKTEPTPEALEKLIELQERWEDRQSRKAYTEALVKLREALPPFLDRDQLVDYKTTRGQTTYRHTSLAHAMHIVQPKLAEFGFAVEWKTGRTEKGDVEVTAVLRHRQGHSEESTQHAPPDTSGHKSPAQAVASAQTLLQRYTLLPLLGLATADMRENGSRPTEADPDAVDTAANLKLAREIEAAGKAVQEAATLVGRPVQEWTGADVAQIREWLAPPADAPSFPPVTKARMAALRKLSKDELQAKAIAAEEAGESAWVDAIQSVLEEQL